MSSDDTCRLISGGWRGGARVVAVLTIGATMLGAHHSRGAAPCLGAACVGGAEVRSLLAGMRDAATLDGWSPTQSFRRVQGAEWGRMAALDSAQLLTVLKINRVDAAHARRRTLVVPDSIGPELSYAPLPATVFALRSVPKFVVVSRRVQAFAAYEYGELVRWGPTSTGKSATPTDPGLYFANWKARTTVSTDDPSWVLDWYVNFIALKGVAFHQYDLPGVPASHGCVRLLEEDARWLYGWTNQWIPGRGERVLRYGTPILVFGDWEGGAMPPWQALPEEGARATVSSWELAAGLAPHLELALSRSGAARELAAR